MVRSKCCYFNCEHSRFKNSNLKFYCFPKNEEFSRKWIINCGDSQLSELDPKDLQTYVICEEHFDINSFRNPETKKLILNAVPIPWKIPLESSIFRSDSENTEEETIDCQNNDLKYETLEEDYLDVKIEKESFDIIAPKAQIIKHPLTNNNQDSEVTANKKQRIDIADDGLKTVSCNRLMQEMDEYDHFALMIAAKIRKINDFDEREILMNSIQNLVFNSYMKSNYKTTSCPTIE
ncbi:hypothetical protein FQA39_LY07595 [Lamprigera yunnana]|nr:hypothetical protein FQA39_LY07595 [Lamprigera yunnana]